MANKAVVGVAALGVGGYMVSEHIKDWQAKVEQRAREQERKDNREAQERRFEESMVSLYIGVITFILYGQKPSNTCHTPFV